MFIRIILTLFIVVMLACCLFGFMATFEPIERNVQLAWRASYVAGTIICAVGLVRVWRPRRAGS
jgi:hypothetical protein